MSLRKSLNKARSIVFAKVINDRVMKFLMFSLMVGYLSLLIVGHIIASLFGSEGYTI